MTLSHEAALECLQAEGWKAWQGEGATRRYMELRGKDPNIQTEMHGRMFVLWKLFQPGVVTFLARCSA